MRDIQLRRDALKQGAQPCLCLIGYLTLSFHASEMPSSPAPQLGPVSSNPGLTECWSLIEHCAQSNTPFLISPFTKVLIHSMSISSTNGQ
jgi:hypothetical protein